MKIISSNNFNLFKLFKVHSLREYLNDVYNTGPKVFFSLDNCATPKSVEAYLKKITTRWVY